MVDIPDQVRQYLNDDLEARLEAQAPEKLNVLIEVEQGQAENVTNQLSRIPALSLRDGGAVGGLFIPATLDTSSVGMVTQLSGVKLIHADTVASINLPGLPDFGGGGTPFLDGEDGPIQTALSDKLFETFTNTDDWGDAAGFNDVVVPRFNFMQFGNPVQAASQALEQYSGSSPSDKKFIPTSQSVDWLLDGSATDGADGSDSQVAVIDTGHTPMPDVTGARFPFLASFVPGEAPLDTHGHGSWCTNTVVGKGAPSTWGEVKGVAPGAQHAHMKALNTIPGTGMSSWILKSMEAALGWGADVISMSLGGAQQGPLDQDPYATFIREWSKENAGDEEGAIFVVAAGNSGPGQYEIGSPGVAEKAITVASWSLTDEAPAVWSSRGPQGAWYKDNSEEYTRDRSKFGADEFVKPDVAAPGGGRATQEMSDEKDEYLHQAEVGWMEGLFDGIKDGRGGMHGTSQATPHVAGLVLRLYEAGIINTAAEFKQVVKQQGSVPTFPEDVPNANTENAGKNVSVGFGPSRESLFSP